MPPNLVTLCLVFADLFGKIPSVFLGSLICPNFTSLLLSGKFQTFHRLHPNSIEFPLLETLVCNVSYVKGLMQVLVAPMLRNFKHCLPFWNAWTNVILLDLMTSPSYHLPCSLLISFIAESDGPDFHQRQNYEQFYRQNCRPPIVIPPVYTAHRQQTRAILYFPIKYILTISPRLVLQIDNQPIFLFKIARGYDLPVLSILPNIRLHST